MVKMIKVGWRMQVHSNFALPTCIGHKARWSHCVRNWLLYREQVGSLRGNPRLAAIAEQKK
jgi:hypothetical protein